MDLKVVVLKGNKPYQITKKALEHFDFKDFRRKNILIKPNAARVASPGEGITTHPEVVKAAIDHFREKGANQIIIGESCIFGMTSEEAFKSTGLIALSKESGVKLIDLDLTTPMEIKIPQGRIINRIKVSSVLKDIDFIVSIPVMKTHMHTHVTLSIKNMKGLLWRREKVRFHQLQSNVVKTHGFKPLDLAISDMAIVLWPHFSIIDATVAMEGMGPAYGRKKEMELVIVGNDPLATDRVATELMGFNPEDVPHLRLIAERGLGKKDYSGISIFPEDYLKWRKGFKPPPSKISFYYPDIIIHEDGACSGCLSTLMIFLKNNYTILKNFYLKDGKIHIGIGKNLGGVPSGTILIGNCTLKIKKQGPFIRGCPPVSSGILNSLLKK